MPKTIKIRKLDGHWSAGTNAPAGHMTSQDIAFNTSVSITVETIIKYIIGENMNLNIDLLQQQFPSINLNDNTLELIDNYQEEIVYSTETTTTYIPPIQLTSTLINNYLVPLLKNGPMHMQYNLNELNYFAKFITNMQSKIDKDNLNIVGHLTLFSSMIYLFIVIKDLYLELLITKSNVKTYAENIKTYETKVDTLQSKINMLHSQLHTQDFGFEGELSVEFIQFPPFIFSLLHIDILKAWYYYYFGTPPNGIMNVQVKNNLAQFLSTSFVSSIQSKKSLMYKLENRYGIFPQSRSAFTKITGETL